MTRGHRREGVASQREAKRSPVPNTKLKALVLIPCRMDSVGGGQSARTYACLCTVEIFGKPQNKTGRGEVTKREAALGGVARRTYRQA